jgi:triosephosphate isomerase
MPHRKPFIAGNWKMFKTASEAVETAAQLVKKVGETNIDVMIAPAYTALAPVSDVVKGTPVSLGAQNLFWEKEGAYTGEISSAMLVSAGCKYVIIGHSERRQYFGETDEAVNKKIRAAIQQLQKGLEGFSSDELETLVMAYEPVWAIGTGKTASRQQAQEVHQYLREKLEESCGNKLANSIRILYGGSVKPDNISELMAMPDVDGALVGGASLSAETFSKIVHFKK